MIVLDEAGTDYPVMCGVMDSSTQRVIENIKALEDMGLTRNACSSLPLCFRTWERTETRSPTASILKIILTWHDFLFRVK